MDTELNHFATMTTDTPTPTPPLILERLSLWDRWFNRYRREVAERGSENWSHVKTLNGLPLESTRTVYPRDWVEYRITDRVTGSTRIEREYLN